MTDPKRRLRRLDEIRVRDLWPRAEVRAGEAEAPSLVAGRESLGRRLATIGVAFAVFAAGGVFLLSRFDATEPRPAPSDNPVVDAGASGDDLRITCTDDGTTVEGSPVPLQADGVHIAFRDETSDADIVDIRDPEQPGRSMGFDLGRDAGTVVLRSLETGMWVAACLSFEGQFVPRDVPDSAYSTPFEVIDPHGFTDDIRDAAGCGEQLPEPVPTAGAEAPLAAPLAGWLTVQAWDHATGHARTFLVAADGSEIEEVAVAQGPIDELDLSPDGSRFVLVIQDDADGDPTVTDASLEDGEIYVMDRDGSGLTRLTDNQASDDIVHWTPDGRISFRSNRDRNLSLYVMDADGTNVQPLVDLESADAHDWGPDGRLALVGSDGKDRGDGCRGNGHELYVANPDGSGLTALTTDELYEQAPAWSPDGSTIAFTASDQSDYAWEIFLVNADGSGLRRITDYPGYDQDPIWSPDGTMIAFTSDRFRGPSHGESQGGLPYVVNADGSGVRPLFHPEDLGITGPWDIFVTDWRAGPAG
jgi:Tol biopolymer transport system component